MRYKRKLANTNSNDPYYYYQVEKNGKLTRVSKHVYQVKMQRGGGLNMNANDFLILKLRQQNYQCKIVPSWKDVKKYINRTTRHLSSLYLNQNMNQIIPPKTSVEHIVPIFYFGSRDDYPSMPDHKDVTMYMPPFYLEPFVDPFNLSITLHRSNVMRSNFLIGDLRKNLDQVSIIMTKNKTYVEKENAQRLAEYYESETRVQEINPKNFIIYQKASVIGDETNPILQITLEPTKEKKPWKSNAVATENIKPNPPQIVKVPLAEVALVDNNHIGVKTKVTSRGTKRYHRCTNVEKCIFDPAYPNRGRIARSIFYFLLMYGYDPPAVYADKSDRPKPRPYEFPCLDAYPYKNPQNNPMTDDHLKWLKNPEIGYGRAQEWKHFTDPDQLEIFFNWHMQYPVKDDELQFNKDVHQKYYHLNPFIGYFYDGTYVKAANGKPGEEPNMIWDTFFGGKETLLKPNITTYYGDNYTRISLNPKEQCPADKTRKQNIYLPSSCTRTRPDQSKTTKIGQPQQKSKWSQSKWGSSSPSQSKWGSSSRQVRRDDLPRRTLTNPAAESKTVRAYVPPHRR